MMLAVFAMATLAAGQKVLLLRVMDPGDAPADPGDFPAC
jgi:hypothetical protein